MPINSAPVQFRIDFQRRRRRIGTLAVTAFPSLLKRPESLPPALRARSVSGCKSHGLVEEEQLCIAPGRHYNTSPAPKFQTARDPTLASEVAHDLASLIVQRAPITHEHSPGWRTKNRAVWVHSIL
jgi:hypothetical protein